MTRVLRARLGPWHAVRCGRRPYGRRLRARIDASDLRIAMMDWATKGRRLARLIGPGRNGSVRRPKSAAHKYKAISMTYEFAVSFWMAHHFSSSTLIHQ